MPVERFDISAVHIGQICPTSANMDFGQRQIAFPPV